MNGRGVMVEGFSWTISGATIIVAVGWFATIGMFLFRRGGQEGVSAAALAQLRKDHEVLAGDYHKHRDAAQQWREAQRLERDQFQVAVNAGISTQGMLLSEFREEAIRGFATKAEMRDLEERTNKDMDRIVDRLEQISVRLEKIGDKIIEAMAVSRAA